MPKQNSRCGLKDEKVYFKDICQVLEISVRLPRNPGGSGNLMTCDKKIFFRTAREEQRAELLARARGHLLSPYVKTEMKSLPPQGCLGLLGTQRVAC